jgi:hypothetical protein
MYATNMSSESRSIFHRLTTKESQKMLEEVTISTFKSPVNPPKFTCEVIPEASPEAVEASPEVRAKSSKELADEYEVSDRTVQTWVKTVATAYLWIPLKALKTGKSAKTRYTLLCQALIAEYRAAAAELSEEDWIASVHAANPEKLPNTATAQKRDDVPLSPTEVMLREEEQTYEQSDSLTNADRDNNGNTDSYQRSEALASLLNSRPQISDTSSPDQNPLVLAIRQKVNAMTASTVSVRQQLDQVRQMTADTQEAIQALEDLEVVERAQSKADRHYQLEKQVYARRLEELGVEDVLGKSLVANAQSRST